MADEPLAFPQHRTRPKAAADIIRDAETPEPQSNSGAMLTDLARIAADFRAPE